MAIHAKRWVDDEIGLLDRSIFTDQEIYQEELEKIFGRAWLFIGHESLVPNPNDFFLSYMGEDPVILTRDSKGALHAFLNMCRHRGNRVVRADDGNAKNFMCTYHGWTFSNEGKLVSVPGLQEAYYGELDVENLGLVSVAHLDTYAGIVFATWDPEAPGLEAYLGNARWWMDTTFNRTDAGQQLMGPVKWIAPSNWKVGVDNASHDMYHGLTTHMSSYIVQSRYKGGQMENMRNATLRFKVPGQRLVHTGNGHSLTGHVREQATSSAQSDPSEREAATRQDGTNRLSAEGDRARAYRTAKREEAIRRLGEHRATRVTGSSTVFPNMLLGVNMSHPRGPLACEFWAFVQVDKDMPDEMKQDMVRRSPQNGANHLAGTHAQDDMDNWRNVTQGGRSPIARQTMQDLSMGIRHQSRKEAFPGVMVSDGPISENGQRGYYARWQEFMDARSWKDIHIDPITAKFEGTATMKD